MSFHYYYSKFLPNCLLRYKDYLLVIDLISDYLQYKILVNKSNFIIIFLLYLALQ